MEIFPPMYMLYFQILQAVTLLILIPLILMDVVMSKAYFIQEALQQEILQLHQVVYRMDKNGTFFMMTILSVDILFEILRVVQGAVQP